MVDGASEGAFARAARAAILSRFGGDVDGFCSRGDASPLPVVMGDLPDLAASAASLSRLGGEAVVVVEGEPLGCCCCWRDARAAILSRFGGEAEVAGGCACGCCWGVDPEAFPPLLSALFAAREAIAANLSRDMI